MATEVSLSIKSVIDTEFAVSTEAAEKVFDLIYDLFKLDNKVVLSFEGIKLMSPVFFNISVGCLYRDFNKEFVESHLSYTNLPEFDSDRLISIYCDRAIRYFKNYDYFTGLTERALVCACGKKTFEVTYIIDNRDQEKKWSGTQLKCVNCGETKLIHKETEEW